MKTNSKLSRTILEFGEPVFSNLPNDHSVKDYEKALRIVITVWNAITFDSCNGVNKAEKELMTLNENSANNLPTVIKQLID
jgi:hypothetical protein